jgi:CubicO group peptidase (beta-lactamase class C family)
MRVVLLVLIFLQGIGLAAGQAVIDPAINHLAQVYANKKKNRGLVIGIIRGDEVEIKGYGHLSKTQDYRPDANTLFEIGSMTGVFTTTLTILETQKGTFRLDQPINGFLPSDIYMPAYQPFVCHVESSTGLTATGQDKVRMICEPDPVQLPVSVSFCDLASHTSGLPNTPRGSHAWNPLEWVGTHQKDPYHAFTREELYDNLYKYVLSLPPGSFFQYSDAGIALLGNLIADINKMSYRDLLKQNLLERLGMYNTDVEIQPSKSPYFAVGHNKRGKATEHWHFKGMAPAAGLRSSAGDLLLFLQANLSIGEDDLSQALAQVQQPRIDVPKHKTGRETMGAYGWFVSILSEESNLPINWINGGTGGFRSFMAFNRDRNIGIVILSNSANPVDKMGFKILEHLVKAGKQKFVMNVPFNISLEAD